MNTNQSVEVIVIGGDAAGMSGALTLARARRSVMVIDSGEPRNAPASAVRGCLSRDGMPPRDLVARGQEEVARYGGSMATVERPMGVGEHIESVHRQVFRDAPREEVLDRLGRSGRRWAQ